ncbi:ARM repeat-containing protein [Meredithblackwellia eburnea MCA 4105]
MQTHSRPYGLARRQSYDPLSTSSKSQSLSLGTLPRPDFAQLPLGQRSVPAVETGRFLASGFRSVSGPHEPGQRTPGGSLVVGSEVFGFGGPPKKDARERWGSGAVIGRDEEEDEEEEAESQGANGATTKTLNDDLSSRNPADWPSDVGEFKLNTSEAVRTKHGLDNLSADFNLGGLPRPSLKTYGSSADLRSPPTLDERTAAGPSASNTPQQQQSSGRPSGLPTTDSAAFASSEQAVGLGFPSQTTTGMPGEGSTAGIAGAFPYPQSDLHQQLQAQSYLNQVYGAFQQPNLPQQQPRRGYGANPTGGFDPSSQDDLAASLRNMNLGGGAPGVGAGGDAFRGGRQQQRGAFSSPGGGYNGRDGSAVQGSGVGGPVRQGSAPYPAYFGSPYLTQEAYAAYADPNTYFQHAGELQSARRDSGHSPSWGVSMPGMPPNDFNSPQASTPRHNSFSYSPAPSFGLAPGAPFAAETMQQQQQVTIPAFPPVMGQQQQILLGRGLRSATEYVAPGPPAPSYTQYGLGVIGRFGDEMRPMRSPLLEEFRTNRHRNWELSDLVNHIVEFSGDQLGSRHIQTKLESASSDEKQLVFEEILPNMLQLSTDVFANYVIQKFFEQGNQVQKAAMAKVLEGHILQLSLQMYGCRVVQKAIECVLVDQQVRLVKELDGHILKCARDAQSNHVVQRALERVPSEHVTFITNACIGQVQGLATHPYGCRVLQRIFENCPPAQTRVLLDELHRYTQSLIQDQYGNYVVQWIIEKGEPADRSLVIAKVFTQVLPLAQQKFASNVIEKCIVWATENERHHLIEEVLTPAADGSSVVKAMLVHPYANYVMQKMLHTAVGPQREQLFTQTAIQLTNLRKYASTYSKHLIAIEKLLSTERGRNLF